MAVNNENDCDALRVPAPDYLDYKGNNFPRRFFDNLSEIEKFQADPTDVCVVTSPKSGTHFIVTVVQMIINKGDHTLVEEKPNIDVVPPSPRPHPLDAIRAAKGTRQYYTHMELNALPDGIKKRARLVYVARNPKDNIVSRYHFQRACKPGDMMHHSGSFKDMARLFTQNDELYGPFYDHVAAAWAAHKKSDNIFFTTYERMVKDLRAVVVELAEFLDVQLTDEQIEAVVAHSEFDSMKKNDKLNKTKTWGQTWLDMTVSPYMRAGKVGDWMSHFSPDVEDMVNRWIAREEERLKDSLVGFSFDYE